MSTSVRTAARVLLGVALAYAGLSHLAWNRDEFAAQVPDWVPLGVDAVVVASGVVEIALGLALVALARHRALVGWVVAAFFVAVFPGNVSQFVDGDDAFGLTSDAARGIRLLFQPVLVLWALWSTEAWATWRREGWPGVARPQA
ncbi:MAG: DoxX family membrane protein [Acidimicrobiales bacterium]|nr:DoxX family membrane protein [Acidimicrobiales bacterium]